MNKQEFFDALRVRLSGLPDVDISERLAFYGEMIDDRIEDGTSEEDAIAMIGSADMVAEQIIADIPLAKLVKDKITPKKLRAWEIVLLVLGSPVWLSLLIAAFAVVFCIYVSLWAVTAALWAVFAALAAGAVGGISLGVYLAFCGRITDGIALIGAALTSAGLAIFMFYACLAVTKLVIRATRKFIVWLKNRLIRKEDIERTTGSVRLDASDADEIFVKTTTGDVTGRLLSGKAFVTTTSTGKVSVPMTADEDRCEIVTTTGDIVFTK